MAHQPCAVKVACYGFERPAGAPCPWVTSPPVVGSQPEQSYMNISDRPLVVGLLCKISLTASQASELAVDTSESASAHRAALDKAVQNSIVQIEDTLEQLKEATE